MLFPLIDVLRGFAALSVVVYHVIAHFNWTEFPTSGPLVWFRIGWMGVDLFFVISGFVISLSAFSMLDRTGRREKLFTSFARHRGARIIPLHYLTCLIFIVYFQPFMFYTSSGWEQFLTHALFIHNFFPMHQGGINGVNWSLAAEMQFYVLIMLAAVWLRSCSVLDILLIGVGGAWLWRAIIFAVTNISGPLGVFPRFVYETELPGMLDEFAFGILLARFVRSEAGQRFVQADPRRLWIMPAASVAMLALSLELYWHHAVFWDSFWMVTGFRTLMGLTCATIVLTACCYNQPSIVRVTLPLRYLGTISYGIYLWHLTVVLSFKRLEWLTGPRALPAIILVTLVLATLSWHFFEKPLMLRFSRKRPEPSSSAINIIPAASIDAEIAGPSAEQREAALTAE